MPSNFTQNYKLNQWEPDDRVLRTDFNADNAKIDAALKAGADDRKVLAGQVAQKADRSALSSLQSTVSQIDGRAGARLLKSGTLPAVTDAYSLSVSDISWASWKAVHLSVYNPMSFSFYLGTRNGSNSAKMHPGYSHLILYPLFDAERPIAGLLMSNIYDECGVHTFFGSYKELTAFWFNKFSVDIKAGVTYKIWGEK